MSEIGFTREDWTAFRTVEGLQRRAGTSRDNLADVVVKELVDNALDAAGDCELKLLNGVIIVQDEGEGIPGNDQEVARIFSMNRPQISSKYLRLPTRGALGNGIRVVVGAVAATGGRLWVSTGGRRLEVVPDLTTGQSEASLAGEFTGRGTRIEVVLGAPLAPKACNLWMGESAIDAARARKRGYSGKTSPHWYDVDAFHELLMSVQDSNVTVRDFISQFDGCSQKAGEIAAEFSGVATRFMKRSNAAKLLKIAQNAAKPVNPSRLGETGDDAFPGAMSRQATEVMLPRGTDGLIVRIPAVVEAWAAIDSDNEDFQLRVMVNGSPCITQAFAKYAMKSKTTLIHGDGLSFQMKTGVHRVTINLNIITPYMPVTSDGKAPNLGVFKHAIQSTIEKAYSRAKRERPKTQRTSAKSIVFEHMGREIATVSTDRTYRFNWRQVFYRLRPIVMAKTGAALKWEYFSRTLVREYQDEFGDEPMAYRDSRGTFYMPHEHESFPLGTLEVERYDRPRYVFNKVLVIEKEGFFEALKADGWPERHDCALLTSKGQPTDAARDLIDLIGESDEPLQVFLIHDCDAAGTVIFQSFQDETAARPKRTVQIVNLGLDVNEAKQLAAQNLVEVESIKYEELQPVARYVSQESATWLQTHRVELNAFTTSQFIEWLNAKMADYDGKVIPPEDHMADHLRRHVREEVVKATTARILAEAKIDDQVNAAMDALADRLNDITPTLPNLVAGAFEENNRRHWSNVVEFAVKDMRPANAQ